MQLRYIYDQAGNKEAVIIPIREWETLKRDHHFNEEESLEKSNIDYFFGIMESQKEAWLNYLEPLRTEWENDI